MKYIIMCGGNYKDQFETPKPLLKVYGEILVERTIRLLKQNGVKDIAISTDINDYNYLDVEILENKTNYIHDTHGEIKKSKNAWLTAYYPLDVPACYLAGDVWWTEEAIMKVIDTKVEKTMFICAPDISDGRKKPSIKGREPLGYKVQDQKIFRNAINDIMQQIDEGKFTYDPISWNLYRYLNGIEMDYHGFGNDIFKTKGNFLVIDDLTTDIDLQKNIPALERLIRIERGLEKMIKVRVKEQFFLGKFNELKNIQRANANKHEDGSLYVGDTFECTDSMVEYLTKTNATGRSFVEVLEIIPEKKEEKLAEKVQEKVEDKQIKPKRTTTRKNTRKSIAKKD